MMQFQNTTTRMIARLGLLPKNFMKLRSSPRQHRYASHGYNQYTRCLSMPRMAYSAKSMNQSTVRRFASAKGTKSLKGKSDLGQGTAASATKESVSSPSLSSFSQFWKSYLQPKPMPDRWTAAWYREMALICTVFAITGSSTMVLVSWMKLA